MIRVTAVAAGVGASRMRKSRTSGTVQTTMVVTTIHAAPIQSVVESADCGGDRARERVAGGKERHRAHPAVGAHPSELVRLRSGRWIAVS